jgi:hypothetical protein
MSFERFWLAVYDANINLPDQWVLICCLWCLYKFTWSMSFESLWLAVCDVNINLPDQWILRAFDWLFVMFI